MKIGWMIEEDILLDIAKNAYSQDEGPVAGYALYLLSLGTQEDEDRMDDWGRHSFWWLGRII
jgi:hypothetical protein